MINLSARIVLEWVLHTLKTQRHFNQILVSPFGNKLYIRWQSKFKLKTTRLQKKKYFDRLIRQNVDDWARIIPSQPRWSLFEDPPHRLQHILSTCEPTRRTHHHYRFFRLCPPSSFAHLKFIMTFCVAIRRVLCKLRTIIWRMSERNVKQ